MARIDQMLEAGTSGAAASLYMNTPRLLAMQGDIEEARARVIEGIAYFDERGLRRPRGSFSLATAPVEEFAGDLEAAQREYAEEKHDNAGVNQFAQKIISTPGKRDGLAWRNSDGTWGGPIAEGIAKAIEEGYTNRQQPYHGYYFKILKGQGSNLPLGRLEFVVNGTMIGGFALAAAPAPAPAKVAVIAAPAATVPAHAPEALVPHGRRYTLIVTDATEDDVHSALASLPPHAGYKLTPTEQAVDGH